MSRQASQDLKSLVDFLESYRLPEVVEGSEFRKQLSTAHRRCLAGLQIWAELEWVAESDNDLLIAGYLLETDTPQYAQIAESFSDLTSAFAAVVHGLLKPSLLMIRSSVETFVRGMAAIEDPSILEVTSLYELLDRASGSSVFGGASQAHYVQLRATYKELCSVTHSSPEHLRDLRSLSEHYGCSVADLKVFVRHFLNAVNAISAVLVVVAPDLYLKANPQARDLLDGVVPADARLVALGG